MIRLRDSVLDIIQKNDLLYFGMAHRLLNLTQVAKYIVPQVEARTKKTVKESAILMTLSRISTTLKKTVPKREACTIKSITVHTNLCNISFAKTPETHTALQQFYRFIQKKRGYLTIAEGMREITVIFDNIYVDDLMKIIPMKPKYMHVKTAAVGISFDEKYLEVPGFIYIMLQQLMLQNINVLEISSTYTELVFYVDERETKLAFDTLCQL